MSNQTLAAAVIALVVLGLSALTAFDWQLWGRIERVADDVRKAHSRIDRHESTHRGDSYFRDVHTDARGPR